MRRLVTGIGILLLTLAACSPAPAPSPSSGTGSTGQPAGPQKSANQLLKVAQVGLPDSMSPEASAFNIPVYWLMYDNLVAFDEKLNLTPQIATRWEQTNPTTFRMYLRKDLTFSNGDKLTAADVEFTLKLILEKKTPQLAQVTSLADAKVVDDYTIDVINKAPDAATLAGMAWVWILPKDYYTKVGKDGFAVKPVGSGPYEMAEFRAADMVRFTIRKDAHAFRKPIATEVQVRSIPQATATVAGLQTGDIDMALGQFTGDQITSFGKSDLTIFKKLTTNLGAVFSQPEMKDRQSPLTDKRVRQALNYAVDKESIVKKFYGGDAQPVGQLALPSSPFWDPNNKPYPYDPAMAKKLLADAGYPNGFKLPAGIDFTPQTANSDVLLAIQSYFRDVGVETSVNSVELGVFLDKFYGRNGQTKGDLFVVTLPDANGFVTSVRGNLSCNKPPQAIWWCNQDFDNYMNKAGAEIDITKRSALMVKASQALANDVSHLYLMVLPLYVVNTKKVNGFVWTSDVFYNFDTVYKVD